MLLLLSRNFWIIITVSINALLCRKVKKNEQMYTSGFGIWFQGILVQNRYFNCGSFISTYIGCSFWIKNDYIDTLLGPMKYVYGQRNRINIEIGNLKFLRWYFIAHECMSHFNIFNTSTCKRVTSQISIILFG